MAAAGEPPQFIYNFQTTRSSVKPKNDGTYTITKESGSDPLFKWHNTGRRNSRGQIEWARATKRRKNPAHKAYHDAIMNNLSERLLAANFGTRVQYKRGSTGEIVPHHVPEYEHYNNATIAALATAGIKGRPRGGPGAAARAPNNNNDLTGMMGKMGIGWGGKKTRRRHTLRKKRRHTRRN